MTSITRFQVWLVSLNPTKGKGVELNQLVNDLLRKDIDIINSVK